MHSSRIWRRIAAVRALFEHLVMAGPATTTGLGKAVAELTSAAVDEFDTALSSTAAIPTVVAAQLPYPSPEHVAVDVSVPGRRYAVDTPPMRRRWVRSYEQRFADVAMPARIRDTLLRYVMTRSAVLRP
jgi:hypothetical protein